MSELISRLEKIGKGSPTPMGFGAASRAEKVPCMAVVGSLRANHAKKADLAVKAKLDAVLLEGDGLDGELSNISDALKTVPWGVAVDGLDGKRAKELMEKGCDFFVVSPEKTQIEAMKEEKPAYLFPVPLDADDRFLRGVEGLPIDAVILSLDSEGSPLTLRHFMAIGTIRPMLDKYMFLKVASAPSSKELEALRDAGVDALVVDMEKMSEKALTELKERLMDLPKPRKNRSERLSPLLPRLSQKAAASPRRTEPDEDDDDEN
jgi:hypothetical protein